MSYELICEGFSLDEELEEQLLMQCRKLVVRLSERAAIQFALKQCDGRVQGRIELFLSNRRLSVGVWRLDPVAAMSAAVDTMLESLSEGDRAVFSMRHDSRVSSPSPAIAL